MTKIPSVEKEILKWMNAYIPTGKTIPVFEDMLEQYATEQREAGAREERDKWVKAVGEKIDKSTRELIRSAFKEGVAVTRAQYDEAIKALTQPPCQP